MKFNPPKKLSEIAELLGLELDGDPDFQVTGINEIHMVEQGDITFVDHPKYYKKALSSAASVVIINQKVERPKGKHLLFSDEPFTAYNSLSKKFRPFQSSARHISDSADIGEGTIIQPGGFIGNHVKIGKNCLIHANVSIYDHSVIGDETIIHSGAVIGGDAFYYKKEAAGYTKMHSTGRAIIGNRVEIGCGTTIDKGVSGDTTVGDGSKLDNMVHVGHDTQIGKNCLFAGQVGIAGVVIVEDDVILWGQVGVQKDLRIGKGAVVLGQSGIGKDLEPNKTYFGSPTRDAREKMKELALIKKLPEIIVELRNK